MSKYDGNSLILGQYGSHACSRIIGREKFDLSEEEQEEIKKEMYNKLKPLIDEQDTKPLANLQWIFNWKYKDRFN
ncbi:MULTISPECIES: hypothetical protein [unclassified Gemella]|uniref:hypothetical protein n=1 Tax=unclassified Gemella TaxID=2624949 RepID=UPI0015D099A0|nr:MULTISPECIES: hypothetical protein [unclassified Gemella]MBF0710666.1 hypothetical protein [Gemella sp. GL1.1]NYS28010.1 hypothetical protein [Gemella sp. GL1]